MITVIVLVVIVFCTTMAILARRNTLATRVATSRQSVLLGWA